MEGKKALVILSPVIKTLVGEKTYESLLKQIHRQGYLVTDSTPGIENVKEEYRKWLSKTKEFPVIDSRCPAITHELIIREFPHLKEYLAPISSILITGANIRRKEFNWNRKVVIVTPCTAFKKILLPTIIINTWQEFKNFIHFNPPQKIPKTSPIPLGFFEPLGVKVYGASGEKNCRKLLANLPADAQLIELLWCEGGCHKGDGL